MKRTISLENIVQNWFMSWEMATQASYKTRVVLRDSATTYMDNSTQGSPPTRRVLSEGYQRVAGQGLQLDIESDNAQQMSLRVMPFLVADESGALVVRGYNIFVEDASDGDYNDVIVTLIACKSAF